MRYVMRVPASKSTHTAADTTRRWRHWDVGEWRLLPAIAGALVFALTVVLWRGIDARDQTQLHDSIASDTTIIGDSIHTRLSTRVDAIDRLGNHWQGESASSRAQWELSARVTLDD